MFLHPRITKMKAAAKRILETDDGRFLLKCFKDDFGTQSIFSSDVNKTMYQLGQKELIEKAIQLAKDDLENINTYVQE